MLEVVKAKEENGMVVMEKEDFDSFIEEIESLMETLEILSDKEMMERIRKSEEDIKEGRVKAIKTDKELKDLLGL